MKNKHIVYLAVFMGLFLLFNTKIVYGNEVNVNMAEIENEVNMYVRDKNIPLKSQEYDDFITQQLMYEKDKTLAKRDDYSDIVTYMSWYINNKTDANPNFYQENIFELNQLQSKADSSLRTEIGHKSSIKVNPVKVIQYVNTWWNKRNPNYQKWDPNNCMNYVSQVLEYSGAIMKAPIKIPDINILSGDYWYSKKLSKKSKNKFSQSTTWINVNSFFDFWKKSQNIVLDKDVIEQGQVGDVLQIKNKNGGTWYHAMVIVDKDSHTIYLSGNTNDRKRLDIRDIKNNYFKLIKFT